jgi:hypothetical protein
MPIATSKNLTIVGIGMILSAIAAVAIAMFDGNPETVPDFAVAFLAIVTGIGFILGKGTADPEVPEKVEPSN